MASVRSATKDIQPVILQINRLVGLGNRPLDERGYQGSAFRFNDDAKMLTLSLIGFLLTQSYANSETYYLTKIKLDYT